MAGENPATTPTPAATGGIDYDKLAASVAAALGTTLIAANKPLLDRLDKLAAPAPAPEAATQAAAGAAAGKDKPLTLEDIGKLIDNKFSQRDESSKVSSARNAFIADKMKDIPAEFVATMPNTDDATKLAAAEQAIRTRYQEVLKGAGVKAPAVGGDNITGKKPGDTVDLSKLTSEQKIEMSLKDKPLPALAS